MRGRRTLGRSGSVDDREWTGGACRLRVLGWDDVEVVTKCVVVSM